MARPYSEQFLISLTKTESRSVGVRLAKLCVKANLPSLYVADKFGVDTRSVYSWFRGGKIRPANREQIKGLISEIERSLDTGELPAQTLKQAKEYLDGIWM